MKRRMFLHFDREALGRPILSTLTGRFGLVFNIYGATVNDERQVIALELEGPEDRLVAGLAFLEESGVRIEPAEGGGA